MMLLPLLVATLASQVDAGLAPGSREAALVPGPTALVEGVDAGVAAAEPAPAAAPAPAPAPAVRVTMKDGQVLTGRAVNRQPGGAMTLELGTGVRLELPPEAIASVEEDTRSFRTATGETWFLDPNRTRYLYGPSAMMLKKGEIYFSQLELLASTVNWGVTDFFSVQAGAAVPLWFASVPQSFHLLGAAKVGAQVAEQVHLAAGTQLLWLPAIGNLPRGAIPLVGLVFGTATYGVPDAHVSFSVGIPLNLAGGRETFVAWMQNPIFSLSGSYRLSRSLALVSENWLVLLMAPNQTRSVVLLNSLAARVMGEKMSADLGLILFSGTTGNVNPNGPGARYELLIPIPVPWLGFTYNFF